MRRICLRSVEMSINWLCMDHGIQFCCRRDILLLDIASLFYRDFFFFFCENILQGLDLTIFMAIIWFGYAKWFSTSHSFDLGAGITVAYSAPTRHGCLKVVENNYCASKRGMLPLSFSLSHTPGTLVFFFLYWYLAVITRFRPFTLRFCFTCSWFSYWNMSNELLYPTYFSHRYLLLITCDWTCHRSSGCCILSQLAWLFWVFTLALVIWLLVTPK